MFSRLRSWMTSRWPNRAERDLRDELAVHLEGERDRLIARGLDPAEAERQARIRFGAFTAAAEACRDERRFHRLAGLGREGRVAFRSLRQRPVFALAVIGSLVLGIGGNVAVFTLMRAALWRPLPVAHPDEIVQIQRGRTNGAFSYVLFQQLRDAGRADARIIAVTTPRRHKFGVDVASRERVIGSAASADLFDVAGVPPAIGRVFNAADEQPSAERVAVLSHRFWMARFQADPAVVGMLVYYDEAPVRVIGVAADRFAGLDAERPVDVWLPVTADLPAGWLTSPNVYWLTLFARVRPDVNVASVRAQLDAVFQAHYQKEILPGLPPRFRAQVSDQSIQLRPAASGVALSGRRYENQLRVLAAIFVCVFLICCANVASLVRARNERRRDEFALRRALGAGRLQILRQLLVEGVLLAGVATIGGLLLAPWIARRLVHLALGDRGVFDLGLDVWIAGIAAALGAIATVVAITWPAWRASLDRAATGWRRVTGRVVAGRVTVAVQLAIVLVLLVVAGLSLSTMQRLARTELGFDPRSVTTIDVSFPKNAAPDVVIAAFDVLRDSLSRQPGVEAVTYAFPSVYDTGGSSMGIVPAGYAAAPGEDTQAGVIDAGPDFFDVLGIRVTGGRVFDRDDIRSQAHVVVVNERFVRKYFGREQPVGRAVNIPTPAGPSAATIVGVVADVRHYGVKSDPWPMVYRPAQGSASSSLIVRMRDHADGVSFLRSAIDAAGTPAQVETVAPLEDAVTGMVNEERMLGLLSTVIASIALGLAALGLYGIVAYGASCRRAEFGIRLALGARRWEIQRLVLRQTMLAIGSGVVAGMAGAVVTARVMKHVLDETPTLDWQMVGVASAVLIAIALVAAWLPAWRAASVDPATILRAES